MPTAVIYVTAAMLFLGAAPLPYGYYMLLRLVACGVFAFAAFIAFDRKSKALPWVYGFMALVFNPIIKIHFPKEMWAVVDVAAYAITGGTRGVLNAGRSRRDQAAGPETG